MNEKIVVIDGNNWLNRAYYARLPSNIYKKNRNAVDGFRGMFNKALREAKTKTGVHIAVAFDCNTKDTFRFALQRDWVAANPSRAKLIGLLSEGKSSDYKGSRKIFKSPEDRKKKEAIKKDLNYQQKILIKKLKDAGVLVLHGAPWEADDYIGSVAALPFNVEIQSRDKDFAQLVSTTTTLLIPEQANSPESYISDEHDCIKHYGVKPSQVRDYLMLCGDSIDNIPGVPGIGSATAVSLLNTYGSLAKMRKIRKTLQGRGRGVKVLRGEVQGMPPFSLTRKLATIRTDVPVPKDLKDYEYKGKPL